MSKLVIRAVCFDRMKKIVRIIVGYEFSEDREGHKKAVIFHLENGGMSPPTPLETISRMTNDAFIRFTPDMEPDIMDQLSPVVRSKLMELLQKESL